RPDRAGLILTGSRPGGPRPRPRARMGRRGASAGFADPAPHLVLEPLQAPVPTDGDRLFGWQTLHPDCPECRRRADPIAARAIHERRAARIAQQRDAYGLCAESLLPRVVLH